jgi:hypothetical protein
MLVGVPAGTKPVLHTPPAHSAVSHAFAGVGQSLAVMHETHAPAPLHSVPPICEHGAPTGALGDDGTPLVQMPGAHWFPVCGTFVLFTTLTTLPAPSHWFWWQVPTVCVLVGVPAAVFTTPHVPAEHVRLWQSVSVPGQSVAVMHETHAPRPLHSVPPFWLHVVPAATGGFEGTPFVQTAVVHGFVLVGRSASSMTLVTLPFPSHSFVWQSPAVCMLVGVPAAVSLKPHIPLVQVRVAQKVSVPGQSLAVLHPTHVPVALHTSAGPHDVPALLGGVDGTPFVHVGVVQGFWLLGRFVSSTTLTTLPAPSHWL